MKHCRGLNFDEKPGYDYLCGLMREIAEKEGFNLEERKFSWEDREYDWVLKANRIEPKRGSPFEFNSNTDLNKLAIKEHKADHNP